MGDSYTPSWAAAPGGHVVSEILPEGDVPVKLDTPGKPSYTVGRHVNCDIVIPHQTASRLHAVIAHHKDGGLMIMDKNSSNGTFLNGERVDHGVVTPLFNDSVLTFAECTLRYRVVIADKRNVPRKDMMGMLSNYADDAEDEEEEREELNRRALVDAMDKRDKDERNQRKRSRSRSREWDRDRDRGRGGDKDRDRNRNRDRDWDRDKDRDHNRRSRERRSHSRSRSRSSSNSRGRGKHHDKHHQQHHHHSGIDKRDRLDKCSRSRSNEPKRGRSDGNKGQDERRDGRDNSKFTEDRRGGDKHESRWSDKEPSAAENAKMAVQCISLGLKDGKGGFSSQPPPHNPVNFGRGGVPPPPQILASAARAAPPANATGLGVSAVAQKRKLLWATKPKEEAQTSTATWTSMSNTLGDSEAQNRFIQLMGGKKEGNQIDPAAAAASNNPDFATMQQKMEREYEEARRRQQGGKGGLG